MINFWPQSANFKVKQSLFTVVTDQLIDYGTLMVPYEHEILKYQLYRLTDTSICSIICPDTLEITSAFLNYVHAT